jgi:putative ABC transport system substrate-binding protein
MESDGYDNIRRKDVPNLRRVLMILISACMVSVATVPVLRAGPPYRVAIFDFDKRRITPDPLARYIEAGLRERLATVVVDHYSGQGDVRHSIRLLQEIETRAYDLVITRTSDALILARHTLFKTPTLYTNANNPLLLGFKTLGPPGGNMSGVSYYVPIEKQLRVYKAIFPGLKKAGFIFDRHNKSSKAEVPETRDACAKSGLAYEMEFVDDRSQLPKAAKALMDHGVDAVITASSGTIYENIGMFLRDTNRRGVPVFSFYKMGVSEGAVAALSSDYFRMAGELLLPMAVKVLEDHVSPGQLPAAFLEKNSLFVNRLQARRFGITIPPGIEKDYDVIYVDDTPENQ